MSHLIIFIQLTLSYLPDSDSSFYLPLFQTAATITAKQCVALKPSQFYLKTQQQILFLE